MTTASYDTAANLALFLAEQNDSVCSMWKGRLKKSVQLSLFGHYLGKGLLVINGTEETITHVVKTCFGTDLDWTAQIRFDGSVVFKN